LSTVVVVDDASDPRLRDYLGLTDVELRRRSEPADGLFMAEGEKVIRRALAAGYHMRSLLLEDKWLGSLTDVVDAFDGPVYVGARPVLAEVTGYDVHRGALAAMDRRPLPSVQDVLAGARRVVVLEDVNDHTNVGAIFRSAAGLGMDAVLVTPRCADPLYRRSVKVSMGAVFSVPWTRIPWFEGPELLRGAGLQLLALTPTADAVDIREVDVGTHPRLALAIGHESDGLSDHWLGAADLRVRIAMHGGIDSLNAAAAAAVAFHALAPGPVAPPR
jgi:tRNA G18 (ribose-2'-O)-methylase SpoU